MATIYSKSGADAATAAAIDELNLGTAATADAGDFATAAQGAKADASDVDQITLTGDLALTIPEGHPAGQVYRCAITQPAEAPTGFTVTYGGQPVEVDLAPSASTLVEVWPGGKVVYPGAGGAGLDTEAVQDVVGAMVTAAGGVYNDAAGTITLPAGGGSSTITADDTPATPAEGESASYLVTSAVTWPAGLVWSTDPDGGVAPTITGTALVSLFTVGGTARAIMGATFPAPPAPADTTAPSIPAGLSAAATSSTTVDLAWTASTDDTAVTGYEYRVGGGAAVDAGAGLAETVAGLTPSTLYNFEVRAYDAAGNRSDWSTAASVTTDAPPADSTPPTVGTMAASSVTASGFTLTVSGAADETALHTTPYAFTTNGGTDWSAYQASPVYVASGLDAEMGYSCNWRVRDAAGNVSTGTAQTVTTGSQPGTLTYRGQSTSSSEVSTYTYTAVPLGAESATRQVLVLVTYWSSGSRTVDSVTIGGISATRDYYASALSTAPGFQVWRATVPTGSTADVVAAFGSGYTAAPTLAVWTTDQPVTFLGGNSADGATGATSVSVANSSAVSGGFAIGGQRSRSNAFNTAFTGLTERYDTGAAQPACGGDAATTGPATVTATLSVACTQLVRLGLAAYRWGA